MVNGKPFGPILLNLVFEFYFSTFRGCKINNSL